MKSQSYYQEFLAELFSKVNSQRLNVIILRGYDELPCKIHNDIDFAVRKIDLAKYFEILNVLAAKYNITIYCNVVRKGLIKLELLFVAYNQAIFFDIWFDINYVGLKYVNMDSLFKRSVLFNDIIFVPDKRDEIAISILKELLHNKKYREDKIKYIVKTIDSNSMDLVMAIGMYFYRNTIDKVVNSIVMQDQRSVKRLGWQCRIELLWHNFKLYGVVASIVNVFSFINIKFFNSSAYDSIIQSKSCKLT